MPYIINLYANNELNAYISKIENMQDFSEVNFKDIEEFYQYKIQKYHPEVLF